MTMIMLDYMCVQNIMMFNGHNGINWNFSYFRKEEC